MPTEQLLVLALMGLPIAGFALTALVGRRLGTKAWIIAVPAIIAVWAIAMYLVYQTLFVGAFGEEGLHFTLYEWIPAGDFVVEANFAVDALTAALLIVVTTVGMLVHIYSIGYMAHDPGRWRFFAYLNLFMFSMLLLVLADNFLLLFAAWELVGLSSYLLIGFWYNRRSAALAAKKAFIVNRVGDFGFALGIAAIWTTVGTLNFTEVFELLPAALHDGAIEPWMMTGIALLLFMGAMGKSAQFPLHVWLPDAMEGPTPVSALIHAATMVNAGVYFVARANPIFAESPQAMIIVASVGIFTAVLAASIAFSQRDIKRVLAYSTLSQLGYMFAALGVGAFVAAIFHLMTHGFFKGLLFLGSGSVIHAVHEEQDMNRMGGLWRKIPITHWTMLIGAIAIAGIPPFAGFFSKDEILGEAFKNGFQWVWLIGIVVAVMTGLYMFRLMGKTFYGKSNVDPHVEPKIHESPPAMTVPLILLAIPSIFLGMVLGGSLFLGQESVIAGWLEPVFAESQHTLEETMGIHHHEFELFGIDGYLIIIGTAAAALGVGIGIWLFGFFRRGENRARVESLTRRMGVLYTGSLNKWWFDELNDLIFVRFGGRVARALWWFDVRVVDGTVNGIGSLTQSTGRGIRQIQTGRVQNYALGIAAGLLVIAVTYMFMARSMSNLPLLTLVTFLPALGALVIAFLPRERHNWIRWTALGTALLAWVVSLVILVGFDPHQAGFQFGESADWVPAFGIQYKLGIDGISLALVVLTTTLTWISILASFGPIKERVKEYMISFLLLEVGMVGVFLALDMFLFYIFWELVLIPMYLIIGIWGGANRIYATIKFVLYTLVGSLLMLVAILGMAYSYQVETGTWAGAFDYLALREFGFDPTLQFWAFAGFFLAFAIKVPMFPFHTWLPDAHVEAPTAGSVILAGVLLKLGGYGLLRFNVQLFPDAAVDWAPLILILSLIGIVYGAIVALVQPDLKKLVAYSSVSHMGFVTLGIFIFTEQGIQGAMMQMIAHGIITGALFLLVGVIYERTHDRTIAKMGGLAGVVPVYAALFGFFVLASLGLPGLAGFVGEFLVILGAFDFYPFAAAIAALAMMLGAAYLLWMYQRVVFGDLSDFLKGIGHHLTDMDRREVLTLTPLVVMAIAFGLFPGLLLELFQIPIDELLAQVAPAVLAAGGR